jgi:hypothetical protein
VEIEKDKMQGFFLSLNVSKSLKPKVDMKNCNSRYGQ